MMPTCVEHAQQGKALRSKAHSWRSRAAISMHALHATKESAEALIYIILCSSFATFCRAGTEFEMPMMRTCDRRSLQRVRPLAALLDKNQILYMKERSS